MTSLILGIAKKLALDVVLKLGKEVVLMMLGRISWKVVIERLLSRVVAKCINSLQVLDTNSLTKDTAIDILEQMRGEGLPKARLADSQK